MSRWYMLNINTKNITGKLSFLEPAQEGFFHVKRIYYIYEVPADTTRGHHAHKTLEQILICVHGKIEIYCDNGNTREVIVLDDPGKGLYIGPGVWRTMKWLQENSVLLVLASDNYNESDYIRDYKDFLSLRNDRA